MKEAKSGAKPQSRETSSKHDLFVIMPFSGTKSCTEDQWTEIFENVFTPAAEAAGLACSRARPGTGSLIKSIVERLRTSYIVLADITDANPNVFYELGVRHSLSKRTIIAAQSANHIPSDLRGYWSVIYGTTPKQVASFRESFVEIVKSINSSPDRCDSPVTEYLEREFIQGSRQTNTDVARKLSALHTELTGIEIELSRKMLNPALNSLTTHSCLSLLLDTRYVDPGVETLRLAYETRDLLRQVIAKGLQKPLVGGARILVSALRTRVGGIRQKISKGTYAEPERLSLLEWSLNDRSLMRMVCAQGAVYCSVAKLGHLSDQACFGVFGEEEDGPSEQHKK